MTKFFSQCLSPLAVTDLEMAMTSSAIGYEYALKALEEEGNFSVKAEQLKTELEAYKEAYFDARIQMRDLDARRLEDFETSLAAQKSVMFGNEALVLQ